MSNIAFQYGPLTIAIQDKGGLGTKFYYAILGSQSKTKKASKKYRTQKDAALSAIKRATKWVGNFQPEVLTQFTKRSNKSFTRQLLAGKD